MKEVPAREMRLTFSMDVMAFTGIFLAGSLLLKGLEGSETLVR